MIRIKGAHNEARVYASVIEEGAIRQLETLCDMEIYKDNSIAIMPDVHAGAGCTIGTTMTLKDAVTPNMVGVDIGCGMETVKIRQKQIDLQKLDELIHQQIPSGMNVRDKKHGNADRARAHELRCIENDAYLEKELKAIGTLGGGNHFIEVDRDDEGDLYVVIHSGSRHLGKEVADIYQEKAYRQTNRLAKLEVLEKIARMKEEGQQQLIEGMLKDLKKGDIGIGKELCYVSGVQFDDYIHDMKIMQEYANINRKTMMQIIVEGMGLEVMEQFTTIHNYIDTEMMILRKGAVSAKEGEKLLIPINMRDGSLICIGKGNSEWNYSAPHGAGRLISRSRAFKELSLEEFRKQMSGIYSSTVNERTLDESPMAYKDMKDIVDNIGPTAEIVKIIKPIYNFKADQ